MSDKTTIDRDEIAKFGALAGSWWDPEGSMRPLHRLNPTRLAFIRDHTCAHFDRDPASDRPLAGLEVLDVGCGGGLLCEPLARLGAEVTGIDASQDAIEIADWHAQQSDLAIAYLCTTAEDLSATGRRFDLVVNMEVVEHVADVAHFMDASCSLVKPGGAMAMATLNRTPKAFLLAVLGAEYVLRWLPRGTHQWRKFVKPAEAAGLLNLGGLDIISERGVSVNPLTHGYRLTGFTGVNYMLAASKCG